MQKLSKQKQQTSHLLLVHSGGRLAEPLELDEGWHWTKGGEARIRRCGICYPNIAESTERHSGLCLSGSQLKCGQRKTCCCCPLSLCLLSEVCSASPKEPEQWEVHLYGKWGKGKYADTEWTVHLASLAYVDCKDLSQVRTAPSQMRQKKYKPTQIYPGTYSQIYIDAYLYIPYTRIHRYSYAHSCTCMYAHIWKCEHIYLHKQVHMHTRTYAYIHMPTCIIVYTNIYAYMCIYKPTYIHIHVCSYPSLWTNTHTCTYILSHIYIENLSTKSFLEK